MVLARVNEKMCTKLYVGNVTDDTKEKDLKEVFQAFGDLTEVAILRGYAFVVSLEFNFRPTPPLISRQTNIFLFQHFRKSDDATAALEALDNSDFFGSRLQVQV